MKVNHVIGKYKGESFVYHVTCNSYIQHIRCAIARSSRIQLNIQLLLQYLRLHKPVFTFTFT